MERRQFLLAPRRNPMLAQCFLGTRPESEVTEEMHQADTLLLRCVETGSELSFWEELERAVKILPPDKVQCIEVPILGDEPFRMWGAPDLAWIHADRTSVSVDDFKTGRRLDADRGSLQIHAYAAWMVLGGARWTPDWRGRLISLRDGSEVGVPITRPGLDEAFTMIERDVRAWRLGQESREPNSAPMHAFPKTEDRRSCRSCACLTLIDASSPPEAVGKRHHPSDSAHHHPENDCEEDSVTMRCPT
jgi:hypothetical protein